MNDGNFTALLRFRIHSGDDSLKQHLSRAASNANYVSKTIQNELLSDICQMIKEKIVREVNSAGFWTVLADETKKDDVVV